MLYTELEDQKAEKLALFNEQIADEESGVTSLVTLWEMAEIEAQMIDAQETAEYEVPSFNQ